MGDIDVGFVFLILVVFITLGWSVIIIAIGKPYWEKWMKKINE